jgi:diguanylate cyclase (GGDEF)-like protein/PAS domain S-box-containing protein
LNLPLRAGLAADDRVVVSVLLVEEDAAAADAVARSFVVSRQLEPRLTRVASMAQALRQVARAKFELVMTDLDLPDSSGLATLVTLRHATDAMVVALAADTDETLRRQALECGANYVVSKRAMDPAELGRLLRLAALQAQTGDALRESEARFRAIFDLAAVGIALRGLDGRWLRVNQKLCEILGYPREELVTLSSVDLTPQDERDAAMEYNERMMRGEVSTYSREKRYLRKDGSIVWVSLAVNVVKGADDKPSHVISVIQDISDRKEAEEKLRKSEERFRSLTMMFSDFYWETDPEHRLTQLVHGGGYRRIYSPQVLLGKASWDLPSIRPDAAGWAAHKAIRDARLPFRDFHFARIDAEGTERHIAISGEPMFAGGRFIGYRGVGTDVTERRRVEERQVAHSRHQEIIAEFGRSALRLHDPQALLDEAVSGAAHALGAETLAFFECVADERKAVLRACSGRTLDASIVEIGADEVIGGAIRSGEPCALQDERAVQAGFPGGWARGFASALVTPVRGERRTFGLLCAFSPRPRAYAEAETGFLGALASVLSAALQRINSEERLAYLAQFDNLTGLPNRALMRDRFAQMLAHSSRHGSKLGVMFVDLDHFKLVNDMQGHAAGDDLLKEVARRLAACVRSGDTVARISGDEFVIILGDLASAESAPPVAQKVLERLAAPFSLSGRETFVTASIGMAIYPDDGDSADALISAADAAMYRAKESGRNSYCSFTPGIAEGARARLQLAAELRRALEREEFRLVYQPKVALGTRVVRGAEALLRWAHPERGLVPPGEFVPVLEETGLIVAVGDWVLRRVCADIRAWAVAGREPVPVSVNLSARQFQSRDLDRSIRDVIDASGIDAALIELEITESHLMQDPELAMHALQSLSEAGVRVAIDDFGTGYSSLSYLTRFPVSALKIDRSFVKDIEHDHQDAVIVRTIVELAHTLGFMVVAEGVETENQLAFLHGLGCEQAQGFLFAHPMSADRLAALLAMPKARARRP